MKVTYSNLQLNNGVNIFYRESGSPSKPTLLLLHGFPTSSRQFDTLIPLLNEKYHIIAPDLPGYGQTVIPDDFNLTFAKLADSVGLLLNHLSIKTFSVYIFDFGAPTGLRLCLRPEFKVTGIISQNGNAYDEGIQEFWDPVKIVWKLVDKPSLTKDEAKQLEEVKDQLADLFLTLKPYNMQYFDGEEDKTVVNPERAIIDYEMLRNYPNVREHQLNLFADYRTNVQMYPEFQKYFRDTNIPILAIWGVNDFIFPKEGQQAFKRDSKNVKLVDLQAGHFAGISHVEQLAKNIIEFFSEYGI